MYRLNVIWGFLFCFFLKPSVLLQSKLGKLSHDQSWVVGGFVVVVFFFTKKSLSLGFYFYLYELFGSTATCFWLSMVFPICPTAELGRPSASCLRRILEKFAVLGGILILSRRCLHGDFLLLHRLTASAVNDFMLICTSNPLHFENT